LAGRTEPTVNPRLVAMVWAMVGARSQRRIYPAAAWSDVIEQIRLYAHGPAVFFQDARDGLLERLGGQGRRRAVGVRGYVHPAHPSSVANQSPPIVSSHAAATETMAKSRKFMAPYGRRRRP